MYKLYSDELNAIKPKPKNPEDIKKDSKLDVLGRKLRLLLTYGCPTIKLDTFLGRPEIYYAIPDRQLKPFITLFPLPPEALKKHQTERQKLKYKFLMGGKIQKTNRNYKRSKKRHNKKTKRLKLIS
jgi:hypothetical protein